MTSKVTSAEEPQDSSPEEEEDLRYFIRVGQADLGGTKTVERSLTDMKDTGKHTACIIADVAEVNRTALFGKLPEGGIDAVVDIVENFEDHAPEWMANRRRDFFSGNTDHTTGSDFEKKRRHDINHMKMISPYKGVRRQHGQKVRGQRAKSTGCTEGIIGVNVEEIKETRAEE